MQISQLQPKQLGAVHFDSDPHGAHIYVDGQLLIDPNTEESLKTPARALLYEGRHNFSMVLDGHEDASGYFDVLVGTTVNIYKRLKPGTPQEGWGQPEPQIWLEGKLKEGTDMVDLIINGTTMTLSGIQTFDNVEITNNGILNVAPYDGTSTSGILEIHATSIHVDATSIITADVVGYRGRSTSGCGEGDGAGCGYGWGGSGAGYGGNGGNGGNGRNGGLSYGTLDEIDITKGSGGGCGVYFSNYGIGGNGGGVISLYANDVIIDGTVTTNGGGGISGGGQHGSGGGSGGGLLLNANNITISGHLNVNGGSGSNSSTAANRGGGGGGGGGRIKIFYTTTYTNTGTVSYSGGVGGTGSQYNGQNGQNGTINITSLYREAVLASCQWPTNIIVGQPSQVVITVNQGSLTENYKLLFSGDLTGESSPFTANAGTDQQQLTVDNITFPTEGSKSVVATLVKV